MSDTPQYGAYGQAAAPVCPRHPDRVSYVRCQRCDRPVCGECQRPAAVGVICVDCARAARTTRPRVKRASGSTPVVTYGLIAVCVVVYVGQLAIPGLAQKLFDFTPWVPEQPWRLLTAGFLHSTQGIVSLHLVMNMVSLWFLGRVLEPVLGRWRFASVFLIGVVGGSVAMGFLNWMTPALGASGGIFALGGALLVVLRKDRQNLVAMGVILGINFVYGLMRPGVAWEAHLGGLVVGVLLGLVYETGRRRALVSAQGGRTTATVHVVLTVALAMILVGLGIYAGIRATDLILMR